ncbi:MAG: FecR domain-containing protein, partial [Acidobacteria bacterium]|nr:FecR domain-containing protein [Acidobacteriota bacterium]
MFAVRRPLFTLAFLLLPALLFSVPSLHAASPAQRINIPDTGSVDDDEDTPDVTDRVARISFVEGTAKIRRADSQDWEAVTLNLPLVEGDEVATDANSRLEIQFGKNQHLRVAESSSLKVVTLRDEGIALSLSLGTAVVQIDSFDKGKGFFEIDAPKTTIAVEKSGTYRIDAGQEGDPEIRVAATDGGEAHVYSDDAGFTLKNGRSTKIAIAGSNAGEWQTAEADSVKDEFDAWSSGRDLIVADKLKQAYYGNYYDDDIYGADDLDGYGSWIHTGKYGWVWRPDSSAIGMYTDWSPYRYGRWEWMPPFGWIWLNAEPWGWATYHHGRWVFDNGYWVWAPYPYYRPRRSWWFPALVVINIIDSDVCWYPAAYDHHYHWDYWGHHGHGDHDRDGGHGGHGGPPPTPGPVAKSGGQRYLGPPIREGGPKKDPGKRPMPPIGVPPGAVVGVEADAFAKGGGRG